MTVEVVEPVGHTTLIHAHLRSQQRINVLTNGKVRLRTGDGVYATSTPDHLYVFDGRSEQVLQSIG